MAEAHPKQLHLWCTAHVTMYLLTIGIIVGGEGAVGGTGSLITAGALIKHLHSQLVICV